MKLQQWAQDWFAAWQASHTDSSRTAQSYQGLLQNTILPRLGKYELAELTSLQLKHFFAGLPGGKAKNTYKLLRTILQQAVAAEQMAENPCTPEILSEEVLAERKAGPHREQPVFTRVEQEKLLAVCEEELWGDLIRFAFATGLPQGKLLALREEDVDLVANRLIVRNRIVRIADEQTEGRKTRLALLPVQPYSVPLPAACKRMAAGAFCCSVQRAQDQLHAAGAPAEIPHRIAPFQHTGQGRVAQVQAAVGFPPVGQPPGREDHHGGPRHGAHRPQRQPRGKILGAKVLAFRQVLGVQGLHGPDMVAGIPGGGQPQRRAQKLPQLGIVFGQQRLGQHGTLAVGAVPGGPQAGGQHGIGIQRQQGGGCLQGGLARKIPENLPALQRGSQGIGRQLG